MNFEDQKLVEVGNYAKGWYGNFTGSGGNAFNDLAVILGHLCGLLPEHVERKQLFLVVDAAFRRLVKVCDPEDNWMHRELITEVFYPNWPLMEPNDSIDTRMVNKMLRIIAQIEVKHFPEGRMVMDAKIARLFPNGETLIARRKTNGYEINE